MFSRKLLKLTPFLILTSLNILALSSRVAHAGGTSGGGGDASEARVDEIRADILKWISLGGHQGLQFPARLDAQAYATAMNAVLVPHAVTVAFITSAQEAATTDPELKVSVDGKPKTCRGFIGARDSLMHIICNTERFGATSGANQYQLVHHEFAGLAGVEQNISASSDYELSNQITGYLVPETVLRLSVRKSNADKSGVPQSLYATYSLVSDVSGDVPCGKTLTLEQTHWGATTINTADLAEITPTQVGEVFWQTTAFDDSIGIRTASKKDQSTGSVLSLQLVRETLYNSGSDEFGRKFYKDRLTGRKEYQFLLNRKSGVLTFTLKSEKLNMSHNTWFTTNQSCLYQISK